MTLGINAPDDLPDLIEQLRRLEQNIERNLDKRREALQGRLVNGRVRFEKELIEEHRKLKTGVLKFLATSPLVFYVTAPVIYAVALPIALLDLFVSIYQAICFRAWGIERVNRSDYIAFDRHHLAYLNGIQKLNCTYCAYANGVLAFVRDVSARTEQFWCPIKHVLRIRGVHERYRDFLEFGDAVGFVGKSEVYRKRLRAIDHPVEKDKTDGL